eukprot:758055-Prymnesium_polylepis.1
MNVRLGIQWRKSDKVRIAGCGRFAPKRNALETRGAHHIAVRAGQRAKGLRVVKGEVRNASGHLFFKLEL